MSRSPTCSWWGNKGDRTEVVDRAAKVKPLQWDIKEGSGVTFPGET